jgi:hypothetical protein
VKHAPAITLKKALDAWGTPRFNEVLKDEIEQLDVQALPLQQGLSRGSHVGGARPQVMIISVTEQSGSICAKAGIFYTGIIAGCSCADDPTPVDEHSEYCVVRIEIDKATAGAAVSLLDE